jgi:hypothetical protein
VALPTLSLLVGAQVPVAVPRAVSDALERVEIDSSIGERGTFRLTFRFDDPTLPERFLLDSGDLLRLVLVLDEGRGASVVMDGVMVVHTLSSSVDGAPVLVVSGEDLTLLMDLVDVGRSFPAMPPEARVQVLLAGYAPLGVVPLVVPPPLPSTPGPAERIPHQRGTDYAYIRSLADAVGFRFTLDPGPAPASSLAYWGPEPRADRARPALSIDFSTLANVESLQLSFDANQRVLPVAFVLEPASKAVVPVPVPNIAVLAPPLGAVVPPAHRHHRLRNIAKVTAAEAAGALLAKDARSAEAMTGHGTLNVARSRVRLRAGAIVEVHGAAKPFDGVYEVSHVHDTVTPSSHSQTFELVRAGIGAAAPGGPL